MKVILIRHAESESNIGNKTSHPESIKLTQNGEKQAELFADQMYEAPDLIFITKHIRTEHTAEYVLKKYPNTVVKFQEQDSFRSRLFESQVSIDKLFKDSRQKLHFQI